MRPGIRAGQPTTGPARPDAVERWLATEELLGFRPRARARSSGRSANSRCRASTPPDGEQVGLFRVVTDGPPSPGCAMSSSTRATAGRGLALWALAIIRDDLHALGVYRIILATADAHGVYAKVGLRPRWPSRTRWMELTTRAKIRPTRA